METNAVSRRSFLGLGAAAVAAGAGMIAAPRAASADIVGDTTGYVPDFMNPPAAVDESTVTETVECEVCVVGIGLAGVCALREAAERIKANKWLLEHADITVKDPNEAPAAE